MAKNVRGAQGKSQLDRKVAADRILATIQELPLSSVAGTDEVGRGPLAGPVVAGAVVLDPERPIYGLADSKTLKPAVRQTLAPRIRENALAWGIGWVWPEEIETLNIHRASLEAMKRALGAMLAKFPDCRFGIRIVVSDGKFVPDISDFSVSGETRKIGEGAVSGLKGEVALFETVTGSGPQAVALVKGDALCPAVSAASIIAKVARDDWMCAYAQQDPRFGFDSHMGYPTPAHWEALKQFGPCPIHRLSWVTKGLRAYGHEPTSSPKSIQNHLAF